MSQSIQTPAGTFFIQIENPLAPSIVGTMEGLKALRNLFESVSDGNLRNKNLDDFLTPQGNERLIRILFLDIGWATLLRTAESPEGPSFTPQEIALIRAHKEAWGRLALLASLPLSIKTGEFKPEEAQRVGLLAALSTVRHIKEETRKPMNLPEQKALADKILSFMDPLATLVSSGPTLLQGEAGPFMLLNLFPSVAGSMGFRFEVYRELANQVDLILEATGHSTPSSLH